MPNPFMRLGTPKQQSTEPPDRMEPVPEHFAAPVFPYRGTEDHGVAPDEHDAPFAGYEGTVDAFFELQPEDEHVVPVRIVQSESARQRRVFRSYQVPVKIGDPPTRVLAQNDARVKATLRFTLAAAQDQLLIGGSVDQATPMQGFLVGGAVTYEHINDGQSEVFVSSPFNGGTAVGTIVIVSVWEIVTVTL